jgi:hypothetical protein
MNRSAFKIFTLCLCILNTACSYNRLDKADSLNGALVCVSKEGKPCEKYYIQDLKNGSAQAKIKPKSGLDINSVKIPVISTSTKGTLYFTKKENKKAIGSVTPTISNFRFEIPSKDDALSRDEALFVTFLLSAGYDDGKPGNSGRDYSNIINGGDKNKATEVIRYYLNSLKLKFPFIENGVDTVYQKIQNGYCGASPDPGKEDTRILIFDKYFYKDDLSPTDGDNEMTIGYGPDWYYSKDIQPALSDARNTSVIRSKTDPQSTFYNFSFDFPISIISSENIRVGLCDNYQNISERIHRPIRKIIRRCEYGDLAGHLKTDKNGHRNDWSYCFNDSNNLDIDKKFTISVGITEANSKDDILIEPDDLKVLLPAPGDQLLLF